MVKGLPCLVGSLKESLKKTLKQHYQFQSVQEIL